MNRWMALLLAGTLAPAWAADEGTTPLLARVQAKVRDSVQNIPRYVCRQDIERRTYTPMPRRTGCATLAELRPADPSEPAALAALTERPRGFAMVSADRARLDVMVSAGTELLSWPGGRHFETADPGALLGGGFAGTGDFAGFVADVFIQPGTTFESLGACPRASCVRYRYDVPVQVTRYVLKTAVQQVAVGFHGTLEIDPQTADLLSMTVIPTDVPKELRAACDLRTHMTYTRTTLNASQFTIPDSVDKEFLASDGGYFTDWIRYTDCRQYTAESSLTFGTDAPGSAAAAPAAPPALPKPGTRFELRLQSTIDSEMNWAGDRVEATLVRPVRAADGRTIAAGTVVRGHLAEVEKVFLPDPAVRLALRFDTIILNGAPVAIGLGPVGKQDLRGRAVFQFPKPHLTLDRKFTSEWRVR